MDHNKRRRIIAAFTLSLLGLVFAVAVAVDGTGTARYYAVFTDADEIGDGHIVDNVNNTGFIDVLDYINLSAGGISNDFRPNAFPLPGTDWPDLSAGGLHREIGNEIETWGHIYVKEWCNGTGTGDCLTYTAVKNGLGAGGGGLPYNISGYVVAGYLPRSVNGTDFNTSNIKDDNTNITIFKNVSIATNQNITFKQRSILSFPDVKTTFGQSVIDTFTGFFGFEAFNQSPYDSFSFLGGFYAPSQLDRHWFIGYGGINTSVMVCAGSANCSLIINKETLGTPNALVFSNAAYANNFHRWRMHLRDITAVTQQNDLFLEFNITTVPNAQGGSLYLRPRASGAIQYNVSIESSDGTNTTLNVNGTIRQERAVYINHSSLNACAGVITLTAGQGWVNTTCVVANSIIILTAQNCGSPPTCQPSIKDRAVGKSFNITSLVNDTSQVGWLIVEAR